MFAVYTAVYVLGLCALAPRALWDLLTGGRYSVALGQRLGAAPVHLRRHAGAIWVHAVSVGEVHAARGLLSHLRTEYPGSPVVLSTTTPTGQELALRAGADAVFYMPLDLPLALRPYLRALRPRAVLLVETEIWPNLLRECQARGVPVALVNARLSERSRRRYATLQRFWPTPIRSLDLICARTPEEALRFSSLGVDPSRLFTTGNLKADAAALQPPAELRRALADHLGIRDGTPLLVAGCTMANEEQKVLLAFRRARERHPELRLLLAPRHPERFDEVAALVQSAGFGCRRRSDDRADSAATTDVILLDTIGELPAAYGLGTLSFVGGSLVPTGGHNLLEPAVQGQPVLFGPFMDNFAAMAEEFVQSGAGRRVSDAAALASATIALLEDAAERERMGAMAREVVRRDASAGRRTARILAQRLGGL